MKTNNTVIMSAVIGSLLASTLIAGPCYLNSSDAYCITANTCIDNCNTFVISCYGVGIPVTTGVFSAADVMVRTVTENNSWGSTKLNDGVKKGTVPGYERASVECNYGVVEYKDYSGDIYVECQEYWQGPMDCGNWSEHIASLLRSVSKPFIGVLGL